MPYQVVFGDVNHITPMNLTSKLCTIPCPIFTSRATKGGATTSETKIIKTKNLMWELMFWMKMSLILDESIAQKDKR
jgi:hypothetical protein